ncbi:MAG: hypothetical protein ACRC5C_02970 [Bacilli bacterium]
MNNHTSRNIGLSIIIGCTILGLFQYVIAMQKVDLKEENATDMNSSLQTNNFIKNNKFKRGTGTCLTVRCAF